MILRLRWTTSGDSSKGVRQTDSNVLLMMVRAVTRPCKYSADSMPAVY